ncbi:Electron transfer protein 1 [Diplonema papillatum]|nr:Electron transfer protein 1 [Diplonema papillatum]|eukprot:gene21021-32390_t
MAGLTSRRWLTKAAALSGCAPRGAVQLRAVGGGARLRGRRVAGVERRCVRLVHTAAGAAAGGEGEDRDKPMAFWLFACSGMVFGIVMVGGITRLTESGLSIVDWRPVTGMIPPLTDEEWGAEFAKYRSSPEYQQNPDLDLSGFKQIFFWEWFHRALGRTVGMVYFFPLVYFVAKGRVRRHGLGKRLAFLGSLGGLQGLMGWLMVKSGLDHDTFKDNSKATVSPYRLAAHLGLAFLLFVGLGTTGVHLWRGTLRKKVTDPALRSMKPFIHASLGCVFLTAMTGAAVAGLDAGWIYCEFPYMGEGIVPPSSELFLEKCAPFWPRNLYENPVFAQFAHRCMAMSTLALIAALSIKARNPAVAAALANTPAGRALLAVQILTVWQVSLGISTLVNETPIPLAVLHQASSLALLGSLTTLQVLLI